MQERKYKLVVAKLDLGPCLHAALRKVCDSKVTSLVYNLIHLDDMAVAWKQWLGLLWDEFSSHALGTKWFYPDELLACCHTASDDNHLEIGAADVACLRCALELFEDEDWFRMLAYAFQVEEG